MRDVTAQYAVINLCGPHARDVLAAITDDDVSDEAIPFLGVQTLELAHATGIAARIGYVGELGYELYIPHENAVHVYDALWSAGVRYGIANAGYRAIESCRLEKGYVYWSSDIGPDNDPFEVGLGFCVDLDKGDFLGCDALKALQHTTRLRRLATLSLDGFVPLHGGEPVLSDGRIVGSVTSCGYGHTLGRTIAYAYLPAQTTPSQSFVVEAFGRTYPASRGPRCLYDASFNRVKSRRISRKA